VFLVKVCEGAALLQTWVTVPSSGAAAGVAGPGRALRPRRRRRRRRAGQEDRSGSTSCLVKLVHLPDTSGGQSTVQRGPFIITITTIITITITINDHSPGLAPTVLSARCPSMPIST
jgi:hypothetical protein